MEFNASKFECIKHNNVTIVFIDGTEATIDNVAVTFSDEQGFIVKTGPEAGSDGRLYNSRHVFPWHIVKRIHEEIDSNYLLPKDLHNE